jgi:hypothetical protein
MKDQYVGDINDFFKYSILEKIEKSFDKKILVVWMLTKSEGMDVVYKELKEFNEPLYQKLQGIISSNKRRVRSIELIYGNYTYQSTFLEKLNRAKYFDETKEKAKKCDIIFFDPDTGISFGTDKKDKEHLYWDEIKEFWGMGKDLLIYQHFRRQKWDEYLSELNKYVKKDIKEAFIVPIKTRNVMFIYFAHKNIIKKIQNIFDTWDNQIEIMNI